MMADIVSMLEFQVIGLFLCRWIDLKRSDDYRNCWFTAAQSIDALESAGLCLGQGDVFSYWSYWWFRKYGYFYAD